jgi:hypothetical protein
MGFELKRRDESEGLRAALVDDPYIDVTVTGMSFLRKMMRCFDMLVDVSPPRRPDPRDFEVTLPVNRANWANDPNVDSFLQADADWMSLDAGVAGIPSYKLESNAEWVVTPREISIALTRYFSSPNAPLRDPFWETFIAFLCVAMACGGLVVR